MARKDKDHMSRILAMSYDNIKFWEPFLDSKQKDYDGNGTLSLSDMHQKVAVYEYILNGNEALFRSNLLKSIQYGLYNIEKFDKGLPIHYSYISYGSRSGPLNLLTFSLVLGELNLIQLVSNAMKFRKDKDNPQYKKINLFHCFADLSIGDIDQASNHLKMAIDLNEFSSMKKIIHEPSFLIYEKILNNKPVSNEQIYEIFMKSYKERIKSKYFIWHSTVFEDMNLEFMAHINLLRMYGHAIEFPENNLIPKELLIHSKSSVFKKLVGD